MLSTSAMLNALPGDKASVRRYVTAAASTSLADGTVAVNVSHSNLRQLVQELRFDLHSLIGDVKRRLYTFNGSSQASMELHLKDSDGNLLARMLDETKPLGYYGVTSGMNIHVVDTDPFSLSRDGGLDDVSRIQKYTMSDEDYERREKSYRAWKREKQAADPSWRPPSITSAPRPSGAPTLNAEDFADPACCAGIEVGMRCSISPGDRRGCVGHVGPVEGLAGGWWVGVRLDEPLGRNSGSVGGKAYFEAPDKHGSFVRPVLVSVGEHLRPLWEEEMGELEEEAGAGAAAGGGGGGEGGGTAAAAVGGGGSQAAVAAGGEGGSTSSTSSTSASSAAAAPAGGASAAQPKVAPKPRRRGQLDDDEDEGDDEL